MNQKNFGVISFCLNWLLLNKNQRYQQFNWQKKSLLGQKMFYLFDNGLWQIFAAVSAFNWFFSFFLLKDFGGISKWLTFWGKNVLPFWTEFWTKNFGGISFVLTDFWALFEAKMFYLFELNLAVSAFYCALCEAKICISFLL